MRSTRVDVIRTDTMDSTSASRSLVLVSIHDNYFMFRFLLSTLFDLTLLHIVAIILVVGLVCILSKGLRISDVLGDIEPPIILHFFRSVAELALSRKLIEFRRKPLASELVAAGVGRVGKDRCSKPHQRRSAITYYDTPALIPPMYLCTPFLFLTMISSVSTFHSAEILLPRAVRRRAGQDEKAPKERDEEDPLSATDFKDALLLVTRAEGIL